MVHRSPGRPERQARERRPKLTELDDAQRWAARLTGPPPATHAGPAGVDLAALTRYFEEHVPNFGGPLRAELMHGGRSNLTFQITDGTHRWIVRRRPLGLVAPTANDVGREYRVMAALGSTAIPVPEAISFCDDPGVIGAPFSVTSMVEGRVIRSASDGARLDRSDAAQIAEALVDQLAAIHSVDYHAIGLTDLGRPDGFLVRQVGRWWRQWELVATRQLPGIDMLRQRLATDVPDQTDATIVHGDFRLDNTILAPDDPGVIAAVIDWEMATLGDPLADLGLLLVYWDPVCSPVLPEGNPVSANPGFPSIPALVSSYGAASGRSLGRLDFYRGLGYFKLAVIAEGIHSRFQAGRTVGTGFETVGSAVVPLVEAGLAVLSGDDHR